MITEGIITLRVRYHGEADRLADIAADVQAEYNRNVEYEDDGETPQRGFVAIVAADPPIHVILNWDFGAGETEEDLTLAELGALIQNGRADDSEGRVTTVTIWTTDALACVTCDHSSEQHDGDVLGYCLNPGCDCQEYVAPQLVEAV